MDHKCQDASTPAVRVRIRHHPAAVALSNAPPTATPHGETQYYDLSRDPYELVSKRVGGTR